MRELPIGTSVAKRAATMARAVLFPFLTSLLLLGCEAPLQTFRYTGVTPAARPLAWDGRASKAGSLRLDGSMTQETVIQNRTPVLHDTALFVPEWTAEGSAAIAVTDEVEIGLRGSYASYDWATTSAAGTMPLPSKPSTWGVGPELRVAIPFDDKKQFVLGLAANLTRNQVPYAEWSLTGASSPNGVLTPCTPSRTCVEGAPGNYYVLHDERSESHLTYSLGVYPSIAFGDNAEYGHAFLLINATNGFANDGFTDTPTNGSSIRVTGPLWILGAGYGISVDWVHAAGSVFVPITDEQSPVNYGVGFQLTLGANLELWSKDPPRPRDGRGGARVD
jgi:hypothetical protein